MDVPHIGDFLRKYREFVERYKKKHDDIIAIIRDITGITLSEEDIEIVKGEMRIKGDFATKNEIFLHKERIIEEINKNHANGISDIR